MVMPNREIVKNNIFPLHSAMSSSMKVNNILEDINTDKLRGRSAVSSKYSSRKSSTHLDISSIPYIDRMEAQSIDLLWMNQTE